MFYKVCVFVCGSSLVFFSVCPQLRELYLYTKVRKKYIMCVVMPLHEWATGSLPPAGRPPTRQVGPSEVHVSV